MSRFGPLHESFKRGRSPVPVPVSVPDLSGEEIDACVSIIVMLLLAVASTSGKHE